MDRLARIIVEHAKPILAATAVVTLLAASMLFRMDFNADVASFVLEGTPTGEAFKDLQEKYDAADPITVVATLTDGTTYQEPEGLVRLLELTEALDAVEGTDAVTSVLPAQNPLTGQALTPEAVGAIPPTMVPTLLEQNPTAGILISEDAASTMVLVTADDDAIATARNLDDVVPPEGMEVTLAGNPVVFATVLDLLSLFLLVIPPIVILLLLAVFYLNIGDRKLSALSIIPAVIGSLWTFGLVFGLGREVDVVTVIVPIFVIVMGSADGLHFITHYQDEASRTTDKVALTASALRHVGVPMILTTVSTAAGFISLVFAGVQPIAELGTFAAIGITFAGIISLFSLPALLSRIDVQPRHHDAILGPRVIRGLQAAIRTRVPATVLTAAILVFAAVFVPRLEVNPDQLFFFKADDPVRAAFEETEELFGGATPLFGEFAYDPQSGTAGLEEVARVSDELEALPGIREVFSIADLAGSVPPEQVEAVISGAVSLPFGKMTSDDGLRFVVFPADFDTDDLTRWIEFTDSEPTVLTLTGMPVVWDEIARLVLRSQVVSLFVAFALVTVLLGFAYRRVRQTVISLVPIALTVLALLGFIAASGIQLNLLTAVVSSIVIGVGIDYAIHFVAAIDLARADGPGYAFRAVRSAGRPIVANALGIAIALTALWLSPLAVHAQVSMLMWVSMTVAAATALLVIPALLPRDATEPESVGTARDSEVWTPRSST